KKDTVTKNKVKERRRVLTKSLRELHSEYKTEVGVAHSISYRQFLRLRPFYVTEPKASDRNTCACIDHENVKILIDKLHQIAILGSKNMTETLSQIVCNLKNKKCMFRQCAKCCYSDIESAIPQNTEQITWHQWQRERVCSEWKTYSHFVKKPVTGTWEDLLKSFNEKLDALAKHQVDEALPNDVPVVKGTLNIHQVTANTPGKIMFRDVSCFCHRMGLTCECESPSEVDFHAKPATPSTTLSESDDMVGKMVIVSYDKKLFVGQVLKVVVDDVEVSCMQQSGRKNCFAWPQNPDVIYYFQSDVKSLSQNQSHLLVEAPNCQLRTGISSYQSETVSK
ncbi:hypothetical protein F7725_012279, partial [Dissostichus mawsoni]